MADARGRAARRFPRDREETRGEALGEAIFGTPLVAGGRVFVALSASGENLRSYDRATGDVAWEVETGDVESSPLLVHGNIVVALVGGAVAAYDTADGRELWLSPLPRSRGNAGTRSSPSSDGERIFTYDDAGGLAALRPEDGTLLWTASAGRPVFGAVPAAEGRVFATTLAGTVRAFDAATGNVIWTHDAGAPVYGAVAVSPGAVVAGTSAGDLIALRPTDGSLLWRGKCAGGVGAAPLVSGGFVYAGDLGGRVPAFDLATGAVVWKIRRYRCTYDISWLDEMGRWRGLQSICAVESERHFGDEIRREVRHFIGSIPPAPKLWAHAVRAHWGVENNLHWRLDVAFREDESRVRKGHADENLAILRHIALNLLTQEKSNKRGTQTKRRRAGWDDAYRLKVLTG